MGNGETKKEKYNQILEYYNFHKKIESYFLEGFNNNGSNQRIILYFIDSNWIKSWKLYTNYDEVVNNIDKGYEYLIKEKILNKSGKYYPASLKSGNSRQLFLNKILYEIKDFDNIINQSTYELFYQNYAEFMDSYLFNMENIKGILYNKMMILLIPHQKRIKVIYKGEMEGQNEIIQLNLQFINLNLNPNNSILTDFYNKNKGDINDDSYYNFNNEYMIDNCDKLMKFFTNLKMGFLAEKEIENEKFKCHIQNNSLFKRHTKILSEQKKSNLSQNSLKNVDTSRFIGLQNIGATCYMNATLQCLVNIDEFTRYLLINDNFNNIINNNDKCEILSNYCFLLEKLCCDENIKNYYSPTDFKDIISRKNPLFEGIKANDSKDLIYFLIEQMNYELNQINQKIKNISYKENNMEISEDMQANKNLMLINFINDFSSKNNNIISKLFFSINENETKCNKCNKSKYNFQLIFSLEFPLEKIYNIINNQNNININNNRSLSIYDCFNNYNEKSFFQGDNSIYCNNCKSLQNAIYTTQIYSLSPILIIILNRGKGNIFQCDVDFPENINIQQYIQNNKSNYNYRLIGVVSHLGSSDMSGHFIAFCRHRITKEWYCYNDAIVTRCNDQKNDYKKGVSYILFYESTQGNYNILFDDEYLLNNENNISNNEVQNQNNLNDNYS